MRKSRHDEVKRGRPIENDYKEIFRLRDLGLTIRQIADKHGCASSSVHYALRGRVK